MKINLRTLPEHGTRLEGTLDPAACDLPVEDGQAWSPVHYRLDVQLIGDECLVTGQVDATLTTPCGRCLEPMEFPIRVNPFQHSFATEGLESIDLTPQIREDMVLGLPLVIRCMLEADGRCPVTGQKHAQDAPRTGQGPLQGNVWSALDKLKEE